MTIKNAHHRHPKTASRDQRRAWMLSSLVGVGRAAVGLLASIERVDAWVYRINPVAVLKLRQAVEKALPFLKAAEEEP